MRKAIKIVIVLIIILGIVFSSSNFMSAKIIALGGKGAWVYSNGAFVCKGIGNDCPLITE